MAMRDAMDAVDRIVVAARELDRAMTIVSETGSQSFADAERCAATIAEAAQTFNEAIAEVKERRAKGRQA